ncbi:hypothetical protein ACH434_22980 [Lysinibacillus fusiformis]|uniref:hypothetical protein n=1 Tax=Lysinibacillus fusiformis TaxID=28031 RepID=UPI00379E907C
MDTDIQFLKDLQQQMQWEDKNDYDSQAAPRFWAVMDYREVPANEDYDSTHMSYFHSDGDCTEFKSLEDLKEFLIDYYLEYDETNELEELLNNNDTDFEELWGFVIGNLNGCGFFDEVAVKEESFIVPNTMFLTKEEAKRHIEKNRHHYTSKSHTYAMTAWRAPKVERLLNILMSFDWDSVQVKEGTKIE